MVMLTLCIGMLMCVYEKRKKERKGKKRRKKERKGKNTPFDNTRLYVFLAWCVYEKGEGQEDVVFFLSEGHVFPRNVMLYLVLILRGLALIELYKLGM